MVFSWIPFLEQNHIEYVTSGPNVSRGNVGVRCPYCGESDPSFHLGISLEGKGWACWRRADHRGRDPTKLVQALLRCSFDRARTIVKGSTFIPGDFLSVVNASMAGGIPDKTRPKLKLPQEFKPLNRKLPSCRPFIKYLSQRGYTDAQIDNLSDRYDLRYCTRDHFKGRLVFPIYYKEKLVTWTGRTIYPSEPIRYKTLHADPDKAERAGLPLAIGPITNYLLWYDDLVSAQAHTLYLVEGPFDALKVRILGRKHGITATCLFTSRISNAQIELLHELAPRFGQICVMLDREALSNSLRVVSALAGLNVRLKLVPPEVDDPGDMTSVAQLLTTE